MAGAICRRQVGIFHGYSLPYEGKRRLPKGPDRCTQQVCGAVPGRRTAVYDHFGRDGCSITTVPARRTLLVNCAASGTCTATSWAVRSSYDRRYGHQPRLHARCCVFARLPFQPRKRNSCAASSICSIRCSSQPVTPVPGGFRATMRRNR